MKEKKEMSNETDNCYDEFTNESMPIRDVKVLRNKIRWFNRFNDVE